MVEGDLPHGHCIEVSYETPRDKNITKHIAVQYYFFVGGLNQDIIHMILVILQSYKKLNAEDDL